MKKIIFGRKTKEPIFMSLGSSSDCVVANVSLVAPLTVEPDSDGCLVETSDITVMKMYGEDANLPPAVRNELNMSLSPRSSTTVSKSDSDAIRYLRSRYAQSLVEMNHYKEVLAAELGVAIDSVEMALSEKVEPASVSVDSSDNSKTE